REFVDYFIDRNALNSTDVMLLSNRKEVLTSVGMTGPPFIDDDIFGEFYRFVPENRCHFWHIALRHFKQGDGLGDRVNAIDTKFNIAPSEQADLFEAAKRLVEEGMEKGAGAWFK